MVRTNRFTSVKSNDSVSAHLIAIAFSVSICFHTIAVPDQEAALGHPLIVVGTQPIVVERLLPRSPELRGRSGSLALPG